MNTQRNNILITAGVLLAFAAGIALPGAIYAVADVPELSPVGALQEQGQFRHCLRPAQGESGKTGSLSELFTVSCINRSL